MSEAIYHINDLNTKKARVDFLLESVAIIEDTFTRAEAEKKVALMIQRLFAKELEDRKCDIATILSELEKVELFVPIQLKQEFIGKYVYEKAQEILKVLYPQSNNITFAIAHLFIKQMVELNGVTLKKNQLKKIYDQYETELIKRQMVEN